MTGNHGYKHFTFPDYSLTGFARFIIRRGALHLNFREKRVFVDSLHMTSANGACLIEKNRYLVLERNSMKIIISPAKKMMEDTDTFSGREKPVFLEETEKLMKWIQALPYADAKKMWDCSDKIAEENYRRFHNMNLKGDLTPAILAYDGIQYQYMAPSVFEYGEFDYVQTHLRILSGFYGVLKPMDGVTPYRLEMQAKAEVDGCNNLYEFWGDKIYREVMDESRTVINLASKEYSKCVEAFLQPGDKFITCVFGEVSEDQKKSGKPRVIQKGVYAKMARGEMVRFMAVNDIREPEQVKQFNWSGYEFREDLSSDTEYVFVTSSHE